MLINRFYVGYMPKHIRKWLKDRQPHIPDQPDQPDIPDQPTNIDLNFNSEYGEVVTGLGENKDEVAVIFKNTNFENMQWTVPCDLENIKVLVVAGGGGGGADIFPNSGSSPFQGGGGGGGGGVITGTIPYIKKDNIFTVNVGKGGTARECDDNKTNDAYGAGEIGNNSSIDINSTQVALAYGGGRDRGVTAKSGSDRFTTGQTGGLGGSGGGGRPNKAGGSVKTNIVNEEYFSEHSEYGNIGGSGATEKNDSLYYAAAGGGGGAIESGSNGILIDGNSIGGNGGEGLSSDITGTLLVYGSGGGGGSIQIGFLGGKGGTGAGDSCTVERSTYDGEDAAANQGGGGGGGGRKGKGGAGGSGIVVLRFKIVKKQELTLLNPTNYSTIPVVTPEMKNLLSLSNSDFANKFSIAHTKDSPNQARLDLKNLYEKENSIPVELKWFGGDNTKYIVSLWRTNIDSEDNPQFTAETTDTSVKFYDLEVGRNYSWTVTDNSGEKITGQFFTEENDPVNNLAPRIIRSYQDNVSHGECVNGRDLGGYITASTDKDGNKLRTKQGLIFRAGYLEYCYVTENENGEEFLNELLHLKNDLKIKNELDLRTISQITYFNFLKPMWKADKQFTNILEESTIGENIKRITVENICGIQPIDINGLFKPFSSDDVTQSIQQNRKAFWVSFNEIYKSIKNDEPILFHCSHGKDRTGALAFVILCYLGVPVDVATKDFILAWATNQDTTIKLSQLNTFKTNVADLNSNNSGTLNKEDFYNLLKVCGEAANDADVELKLNEFRDLMLEVVETKITEPPKSLNVLTIGNSFSKPLASSTALPLAVKKINKKINYGHLYKGALSLEDVYNYIQDGATTFDFTTCFTSDDGTITEKTVKSTIANALKNYEWDIVTIQQRSVYSHNEEKYQTYVNDIIDKIHEIAPNVKIDWHLTWSFDRFAKTVANIGFNFNGNIEKRDDMYDNIVNVYNNKVKDFVDDVIPVGYAIQLYRYRLPVIEPKEDFTCYDHQHLNPLTYTKHCNSGGIYLLAICWCYALFGDAPTIEQFNPYMINDETYLTVKDYEEEIRRLRKCAIDACNNADIAKYGQGTIEFNWTVKFLDNNNNIIDTQIVSNGQCITVNDIINNTSNNWLCEYRASTTKTEYSGVITKTVDMTLDEIKVKPIYDNITFTAK